MYLIFKMVFENACDIMIFVKSRDLSKLEYDISKIGYDIFCQDRHTF